MKYIPVAGTFARKRDDHAASWYRIGSPLDRLLDTLGYQRVDQNGDRRKPDQGFWSGDINGLMLQRALWWRDKHPAWKTGGETLRKFMLARRAEFSDGVTLVLHSHGGQVGAYALADLPPFYVCGSGGCEQDNLSGAFPIHVVTCDMPVRADMREVYSRASRSVVSWTHLYSEPGWKAMMRKLGDGQIFSNPRLLSVATHNIEVAGGHSGYLSDPKFIGQWNQILGKGVEHESSIDTSLVG